jgi:histidinol dehydrogenase
MKIIARKELPESFFVGRGNEDADGVRRIVEDVRRYGDWAVRHYTRLFDGVETAAFRVPWETINQAKASLEAGIRDALHLATRNIRTFAEAQKAENRDFEIETSPGVFCGQRLIPIERIGIYVPAGRFPLVSSLLMGVVPALVAGVGQIAVFSPPTRGGTVHPVILGAAGLLGLEEIYAVGGAQAVAAMAFGTESIPRVDKIVGPGNRFVTAAKREVFGTAGIDIPAGPSEVMIVADGSADPAVAAADLLAQAEHDPAASAVLLTDAPALARAVDEKIDRRLSTLPDPSIALRSMESGGLIVVLDRLEDAVVIADRKAPEHLELQGARAVALADRFRRYGALFIGSLSGEVFGDYTAGTNHILPTGTAARFASGLQVRDFLNFRTTLRIEERGITGLVPATRRLAEAEGLAAHAAAAAARLNR